MTANKPAAKSKFIGYSDKMHSEGCIMKSLFICAPIILLVVISCTAGCIANQNITGTPQSVQSVTPTSETSTTPLLSGGAQENASRCTIPSLVFNNRQEITNISWGFGFSNDNTSYTLPYGSILYHGSDGYTRVFDRNGTQILMARDSDNQSPTPGGLLPSTKVLQVPNGAVLQNEGNVTYVTQDGACIGTIIDADTSSASAPASSRRICNRPMEPVVSIAPTPGATPDDGLCHCQ